FSISPAKETGDVTLAGVAPWLYSFMASCRTQLLLHQLEVHALAFEQFLMAALLDNRALVQHQDLVGLHDGAEAVRDDDRGAPAQDLLHVRQDIALGLRIERRGR